MTDDLDRDLQGLDPAPPPRPDAGRGPAAQALLERVLETPRSAAGGSGPPAARHPWHRWVVAGAAAAAVAVGLVAVSPWSAPEQAFATWTVAPQEVPAAVAGELGAECTNETVRDALGQEVVLAEERGRISFVVTATPGGTATPDRLRYCLLVDGSFHTVGGGSVSPALGGLADVAETEARAVIGGASGIGDDAYSAILGVAGEDVVAVDVHPRGRVLEPGALPAGAPPESVAASIEDGVFAAWFPGITEDLALTVHLADGTVQEDLPAFPDRR